MMLCAFSCSPSSVAKVTSTVRHDNSWRHRRHASGTTGRKMRNLNADDHKFASILIFAYIYDATIASLTGMTTILRLPKG
jgi:hypothetical protein